MSDECHRRRRMANREAHLTRSSLERSLLIEGEIPGRPVVQPGHRYEHGDKGSHFPGKPCEDSDGDECRRTEIEPGRRLAANRIREPIRPQLGRVEILGDSFGICDLPRYLDAVHQR